MLAMAACLLHVIRYMYSKLIKIIIMLVGPQYDIVVAQVFFLNVQYKLVDTLYIM